MIPAISNATPAAINNPIPINGAAATNIEAAVAISPPINAAAAAIIGGKAARNASA